MAFKIDNTLPSLVNLNEDPQLSEVLLYILKEGVLVNSFCSTNVQLPFAYSVPFVVGK